MRCRPCNVYVLMALALLAGTPGLSSAETFYVSPGGKTGLPTIQAAVDMTRDGDTVVLEAGTYTGPGNWDVDLRGKAITVRSSDPENADVVRATIIDCQGGEKSLHRAFYVVGAQGATISGLTITNGLADSGGAVYCENSDLTLAHCRITANATLASGPGGGVCSVASTLALEGCEISGNSAGAGLDAPSGWALAGGNGGGLYAADSFVRISDCTIADNSAGAGGNSPFGPGRGGHGGGIYADSVLVVRSSIEGNSAGKGGDGVQAADGGQGGGIYCSRAAIENCTIEGNSAGAGGDSSQGEKGLAGNGGEGGGIFCTDSLQITSSLVAGNRTGRLGLGLGGSLAGMNTTGGGISCGQGVIDHCTIVSNIAGDQALAVIGDTKSVASSGGGMVCSGEADVTNSIVWGNTPDQLFGVNLLDVAYCDVEGTAYPVEQGNISIDPAFVQPGQWANPDDPAAKVSAADPGIVWVPGDYRLTADSACVDAGDPDYASDPNAVDLDGSPRLAGKATDMGAYEVRNLVPVYRYLSNVTGKHFYTADVAEQASLAQQPHIWTFEGVAYLTYVAPTEPGLKPVYRFWSEKLASHFWTISEAERDLLISEYADAWAYEGPVFFAYPEGVQPADAKPVYRFWSGSLGTHFYTIDEAEKDLLVKQQAGVWDFEGIVWYAYEASDTGQEPPGPQPQADDYGFACDRMAASYAIELKAYLDGREVRIDNPSVSLSSAIGYMEMTVDLGAMTTTLTGFRIVTEPAQHAAVVTDSDVTGGQFPLTLSVQAFFDATTARGPLTVNPQTLAFPTAVAGPTSIGDEVFQIVGSAVFEGQKYDVNLTVPPTDFELQGSGTFDNSGYPERLDVNMDGPFQWRRQGQADLLFEANVKSHVLQLYVTSVQLRSTGFWLGKSHAEEGETAK
ncbi:MAG: hypothetical protein JW993_18090 [Sedimentisphaerales bacterium]|nr:hypothetical protein [Sedimentisphaerales bacterium]